jgi:hypothetical protein
MIPQNADWESPLIHTILRETLTSSLPVFAFEFDRVFGLVAPFTPQGIDALNQTKKRLAGKTYGSIIADRNEFIANSLLPIANPRDFFSLLKNSFIRVPFKCFIQNSDVVCNGTHQALIADMRLSQFFQNLHKTAGLKPAEFFHFPYSSFLITSANFSGDKKGAIIHPEKIQEFCVATGIKTIVMTRLSNGNKGSYPILDLSQRPFTIARAGTNDNLLLNNAQRLFPPLS